MTGFATFGDPSRFEIAVRWFHDPDPRERRPAHGGWSTGELRLTVGGHVLTRHRYLEETAEGVRWYLMPVFEWLAEHWVKLLHEERFAWRENSAAPAATACFLALRRFIGVEDDAGQRTCAEIQDWWSRHALRAADAGALYPDVFFRRLFDDLEISWTARQPAYAPDGFRIELTPGAAILPIAEVARPLWEALNWIVAAAPPLNADDRKSLARLDGQIKRLADLGTADLEAAYLSPKLIRRVAAARVSNALADTTVRLPTVPALAELDDAVLMFGGVSPDIGAADARSLTAFLAEQAGGDETPALGALVDSTIGVPLSAPFEDGYDLAERLLDQRGLSGGTAFVDIRSLLSVLDIRIVEQNLKTNTIRGVAIAGDRYRPAIMLNLESNYNKAEEGRRFTLAHELCHILYDRVHAKRVVHTSGPWAPQGIEKRANAFAAMLLMPRELVRRSTAGQGLTLGNLEQAANAMRVGVSALIEHSYNIGTIDELERDDLRAAVGRGV